MPLNESKGNMYQGWITHTWNTIKGECYHGCSYCYMKRWKNLKPVRFDEKELNTDLGIGNFIFVGSSCDMWSEDIPDNWIAMTLDKCFEYPDNKYLFQSKNPKKFEHWFPISQSIETILTTTIETNRIYNQMNCKPFGNTPTPHDRSLGLFECFNIKRKMITIEPIMDFDLIELIFLIKSINPEQVNIGADSGNNNLPEPSWFKVEKLIEELQQFTTVKLKKNLDRLRLK